MCRPTCVPLAFLAALLGCGGDELGLHKLKSNRPPETTLSSGPRDLTTGTPYVVELFWSGKDPDGTIDHYDFILVDHPAARSGFGAQDSTTNVVITVPDVDDPRWVGTSATDSIFVTIADTLRRDPQPGPGESAGTVRDTAFERWHTFFIRAVDNEGMPDPTPDHRTFNAKNIAPTVHLLTPVRPAKVFAAPSTVVFNWDGEDAFGSGNTQDPVAARWVIIPSRVNSRGDFLSFPDSLYHLPRRGDQQFTWSPWARWDASDGSGQRAVIRGLHELGSGPNEGHYIFAVQAMDEAGAVTPVFDWTTPRLNNVCLLKVTGRVGPTLTVEDRFLGQFTFADGARPVRLDIAVGQPVAPCWWADASLYGGSVTGYRFGWDIVNLADDLQWSSWATATTCAPARTFNTGTHRFYLQVRDNADYVLQATFEFAVHSVTRTRDLLWVDDTMPVGSSIEQESREDQLWYDSFEAVARTRGFDFTPSRDTFDTQANALVPPPIGVLFDYKAVVWSVRALTLRSVLAGLARFVDPFDPDNVNTVRAYNYLLAYVRNGGKLWINGFRPANELWPLERPRNYRLEAINVLTWDPGDEHPLVDSVGVFSLLYEMGVEMWDCGGGTGCFRSNRNHFCRTVERAAPQGSADPAYATSVAGNHAHVVRIPTADVDAAPVEGRTYSTTFASDHQHVVTLTQADFLQLQRGNVVIVATSEDGPPGLDLHQHTVEIADRLGLWGAPALAFGPRWDQVGPGSGQANVEVYNMPGAMNAQTPPLRGRPHVMPLYQYRSAMTPAPGVFFPNTPDLQPVFILSKHRPTDHLHSRALMGFEAELLSPEAHQRLVDFIVWRQFRVDLDDF